MTTFAEAAIAAKLAAAGFGTVGTDIFVNTRPPHPDNLISVFGYAGQAPESTHDTSGNERPGIQVWVRNTSATTCRQKVGDVFDTLDGITNTTLSGRYFLSVDATASPAPMGCDENGRHEYVANFSTIVRR